jgi:hypothetical protein
MSGTRARKILKKGGVKNRQPAVYYSNGRDTAAAQISARELVVRAAGDAICHHRRWHAESTKDHSGWHTIILRML